MSKSKIRMRLSAYNDTFKENNEIYHHAARRLGLSDSAFWIMYELWESGRLQTQSELCSTQCLSKQTVNSALKRLAAEGCIELSYAGDRRSKLIHLTEKGTMLAQQTVDKVIEAEEKALQTLSDEAQETFIKLFDQYTKALAEAMKGVRADGDSII